MSDCLLCARLVFGGVATSEHTPSGVLAHAVGDVLSEGGQVGAEAAVALLGQPQLVDNDWGGCVREGGATRSLQQLDEVALCLLASLLVHPSLWIEVDGGDRCGCHEANE